MSELNIKGIWLSKAVLDIAEINAKEKMILALSINLYKSNKKCFISNKVISKLIGVESNRVSKLVSSLKNKGYIRVKIKYKENSREIEFREIIPIVEKIKGYCQKEQEGMVEKDTLPIGENAKDINNNINNNYKKIIKLNNKFVPYQNQTFTNFDWNKFYIN